MYNHPGPSKALTTILLAIETRQCITKKDKPDDLTLLQKFNVFRLNNDPILRRSMDEYTKPVVEASFQLDKTEMVGTLGFTSRGYEFHPNFPVLYIDPGNDSFTDRRLRPRLPEPGVSDNKMTENEARDYVRRRLDRCRSQVDDLWNATAMGVPILGRLKAQLLSLPVNLHFALNHTIHPDPDVNRERTMTTLICGRIMEYANIDKVLVHLMKRCALVLAGTRAADPGVDNDGLSEAEWLHFRRLIADFVQVRRILIENMCLTLDQWPFIREGAGSALSRRNLVS